MAGRAHWTGRDVRAWIDSAATRVGSRDRSRKGVKIMASSMATMTPERDGAWRKEPGSTLMGRTGLIASEGNDPPGSAIG